MNLQELAFSGGYQQWLPPDFFHCRFAVNLRSRITLTALYKAPVQSQRFTSIDCYCAKCLELVKQAEGQKGGGMIPVSFSALPPMQLSRNPPSVVAGGLYAGFSRHRIIW